MINVPTSDPGALLEKLKAYIRDGKIKSWSCDKDGDFTLTFETWNQKAWLRPRLEDGSLKFHILRPKGVAITKSVYSLYHARMLEVMLRFFDQDLSGDALVTTFPVPPDDIS